MQGEIAEIQTRIGVIQRQVMKKEGDTSALEAEVTFCSPSLIGERVLNDLSSSLLGPNRSYGCDIWPRVTADLACHGRCCLSVQIA